MSFSNLFDIVLVILSVILNLIPDLLCTNWLNLIANLIHYYILGLKRNLGLGDGIYDCQLIAVASVQSPDAKSVIFTGDFNAYNLNFVSPRNADDRAVYNIVYV